MSNYSWPRNLPTRPSKAYRHVTAGNSLSFEMDTGASKVWRVTSANSSSRELTYILREKYKDPSTGKVVDQRTLFLAFWELVDANLWFWLPDPENPEQEIYVRIKAPQEKQGPSIELFAFRVWKTSFTVEVAPLVPARPRN